MKGIALGALTGVISLSFHNLVDFNLHVPSNIVLYAAEAALAIVAINTRLRPAHECLVPETIISLKGWKRARQQERSLSLSQFSGAGSCSGPLLRIIIFHVGRPWPIFSKAIELDNGRAEYHCSLGRAFYRIPAPLLERDDLIRKGVKEMETGIALNPRDPDCHCDLGWMFFSLGLIEKAEEQIKAKPGEGLPTKKLHSGPRPAVLDAKRIDRLVKPVDLGIEIQESSPDGMVLLSHWNLRDELKADYADSVNGFQKQGMIFKSDGKDY
jgi:hypothetical protein